MSAARSCQTIAQLAAALRRRHPHLAADLDDLTHLAAQIQATYPLAASCINPGDGLRSPNLTGGGRGGGISDPAGNTAADHVDRGRLTVNRADTLLADAEDSLRRALSVPDGVQVPDGRFSVTTGTGEAGEWKPELLTKRRRA